jgi:hypothetical protein
MMGSVNQKAILKEIKRRVQAVQEAEARPKFDLTNHLFPKQLDFVNDPSKRKSAVCSRRSGKSEACVGDLINTCNSEPNVNCAYITLTRVSAKKIIWRIIKRVLKEYQIPVSKIDEGELSVEFANGSMLYISGAKDASEIEKFRGMSLRKVYIDEGQSFRSYIKELIDDIIDPATWDVDGTICLIGTPGAVPVGFFHDITHSDGWSNHKWTIFDNPFIKLKSKKDPEEILKQTLIQRGVDRTDPSIQREFFGNWTADTNSLVFRFNKSRNIILQLPPKLTYIFGIDLGYNDADAIAVLGYENTTGRVYLVEEFVKNKLGISDLVLEIERLKEKYEPVKMVMDAGALGKKIQEEIRTRHGIPIEAADKNRKLEFIELMNDDLRTEKLLALPGSRFEEDCLLVQWNREDPVKPKISDMYHSDICDAVLYAWRECRHYFKVDVPKPLHRDSDAYMDALEAKEAEAMEAKLRGDTEDWGVEDDDLNNVFGDDDDFGF